MLQVYHYHTSPEVLLGYETHYQDSEKKAKKWREIVKWAVLDLNAMSNIYDSEVAAEQHKKFSEITITFNDRADAIGVNITKGGKTREDVGHLVLEYSPVAGSLNHKMLMIVQDELIGTFDLGKFWGVYHDQQVEITEMQDELFYFMKRVRQL
jgi:hypothetical protein